MRARANIKGHPMHPMLIAFPIGLWVGGFLFDALGLLRGNNLLWAAGFYCVIGGCIGAVASAAAGVVDLFSVVPPQSSARQRGYIHGGLNTIALLLFIYAAWYRGDAAAQPDKMAMFIQGAALGLVAVSGWLGGTLVYRNQIGVDHRYAGAGKEKRRVLAGYGQPVCNQSELADGQMMLAEIDGERIVVARCSDGMVAFSDYCTHKGGPLFDGALIGCTVQCPWHGSNFDVRTGRVVAGPAEEKIDVYETEIRAGEVYVKAPPDKKGKRSGGEQTKA